METWHKALFAAGVFVIEKHMCKCVEDILMPKELQSHTMMVRLGEMFKWH